MKLGRIFMAGMLISFFGALSLGTLNVAALQLYMIDGIWAAFNFVCGCIMAEAIYVRVSLLAMDRIMKHETVLKMLNWMSLVFMLVMAVSSILASVDRGDGQPAALVSSSLPPFILGFLLMGVNVMQIPFWFGWNTVLLIKRVLTPDPSIYNMYMFGIFVGSLAGNFLFLFAGQFALMRIEASMFTMNACVGVIFAMAALVQYVRIRTKATGIQQRTV